MPTCEGTSAEGVARGGYVLEEAEGDLQVILMASGSEVQIAVAARKALQERGDRTRVVSVPCLDWFAEQDQAYLESVLPPAVRARVSVEAGIAQPGAAGSATPGARVASSTSAPRRTPGPCTASSASPPRPPSPRPRILPAGPPARATSPQTRDR